MPAVKTRFAPSPTGRLHLGNARTALFSALLARREGGVFLLRVEDTDAERSRPDYLEGLVDDLRWLGLDWQEGYRVGGAAGPYRQAERGFVYGGLFGRLDGGGLAYPCFCSPERLQAVRRAQLARGEPPRYDGACAGLSREEANARLARGAPAVLRFRVPPGEVVQFEDVVRGLQRFETDRIGDFVIRRADGSPAFFFCNAVDDALMGVTHVLRAEDHLSNTPRQLLILRALGLPAPRYAHVSLIVDETGAPLSKREGSLSLETLREQGYLPIAVCNYLARLGHHYTSDACLSLDDLAAGFDLAALGSAPARFEPSQLRHWQHAALAGEPVGRLWDWVGEGTRLVVPMGDREPFFDALRGNVLFPAEFALWARRLFVDPVSLDPPAREAVERVGEGFFRSALAVLEARPADFRVFADRLRAATGASGKALYRPLRAALTGAMEGPELARVFSLLGGPRVGDRLLSAGATAARASQNHQDE
jgi:glutamyl-tRNA synthetase